MQSTTQYEERTGLVKTANMIIEDSKTVWGTKRPLNEYNIPILKKNLNTMIEDLSLLKELSLDMYPRSIDARIKKEINEVRKERVNYFESVAVIPRRLLKRVERLERSKRNKFYDRFVRRNNELDQVAFFVDYRQPIRAMNDGAMAIKMAEQVREGKYTVDELNELSKQTGLRMREYVRQDQQIPDKSAPQIALYEWCVMNVVQPIVEIDDENILCHRIGIGHPEAWRELNNRKNDTFRYMDSVRSGGRRERYTINMGRHKMHVEQMDDGRWFIYLCYPELISIESSPWLISLLLNRRSEGSLPTEQEQPYIS